MKQLLLTILIPFMMITACAGSEGYQTVVTTLATAGVRQTMMASAVKSNSYLIQNPTANTDSIFVGGSDVTTSGSTQGTEVIPGAALSLDASSKSGSDQNIDPDKIFMISGGTAVPVVVGFIKDRT